MFLEPFYVYYRKRFFIMIIKILVFLFILSLLNVIREGYNFIVAVKKVTLFNPSIVRKVLLMVSLATVLTILITGFNI